MRLTQDILAKDTLTEDILTGKEDVMTVAQTLLIPQLFPFFLMY